MKLYFKTILFLALFFLGYIHHISCQDYIPFPTENAEWSYFKRFPVIINNQDFIDTCTLHYIPGPDTLIGSYTYTQLLLTKDSLQNNEAEYEYIGAYRNQERKVLFIKAGHIPEMEYTLYDFGLSINEVWEIEGDDLGNTWEVFLHSIDSIALLDGSYRRRYNFHIPVNDTASALRYSWIEGIGKLMHGLFPQDILFMHSDTRFLCFQENGLNLLVDSILFEDFDCHYEGILVADNALQPNSVATSEFRLFPNPSTNLIVLDKKKPMQSNDKFNIKILNLLGEQFLNIQAKHLPCTLDVSHLPAGLYYVEIALPSSIFLTTWMPFVKE